MNAASVRVPLFKAIKGQTAGAKRAAKAYSNVVCFETLPFDGIRLLLVIMGAVIIYHLAANGLYQ